MAIGVWAIGVSPSQTFMVGITHPAKFFNVRSINNVYHGDGEAGSRGEWERVEVSLFSEPATEPGDLHLFSPPNSFSLWVP